ncbi:hypothetical protein ACLOJK_011199 [Asimina triloba]
MIPSNCGASMLLDVRHHLFISPLPASLAILPSPWNTTPPPPLQNPKPSQQHRCIRCFSAKRSGSSWDSNAESLRAGRFRFQGDADQGRRREKRKWWSDEDEDDDNESSEIEEDSDAFDEQLWDTFWIFKVFRSYGWMLPAIIISMLLATGPAAFLMALAFPLGQSVLSLAVDKVWGSMQDRPKRKSRSKKKNQENRENSGDGQRWGYKTWVVTDDGLIDKDNSQRLSSFGGWDELDRPGKTANKVRGEQPGRTINRPSQPRPQRGKLTPVASIAGGGVKSQSIILKTSDLMVISKIA